MSTIRAQEEASAREFAAVQDLSYLDTTALNPEKVPGGMLTVEQWQQLAAVPIAIEGNRLTLGFVEAADRAKLAQLAGQMPTYQVSFFYISETGYNTILNILRLKEYAADLTKNNFSEFAHRLGQAKQQELFGLVAQLALVLRASDVHIEPGTTYAQIRFRIDGILHHITGMPMDQYKILLSELQTRAGMKWGGELPQSGRVTQELISADGRVIPLNMRLETIPVMRGEEIVIRFFGIEEHFMKIDNLQLSAHQRETIYEATAHNEGLVLSVGPTGSGKTTMLYGIINHLKNPEIKVVSLEDPVEFELDGVTQIPISSDNQETFAATLRAVLRIDPDIVMIGEIRDIDTAMTALQASLTGHLVLSTFHAANASAAVARLMDMIEENPLIASSIRLIQAQRLLRKVCERCKEEYRPSKTLMGRLHKIAEITGKKLPEDAKFYRGRGCAVCNNFGFSGRVGIIEQLSFTPKIQDLISSGRSVNARQIEELARSEGMVSLLEDGIAKAQKGLVSIEEVLRVIDL